MATAKASSIENININQFMVAAFAIVVAAGAFIVLITNIIVGSRVNALSANLAAMQSSQNNPVTVTPGAQTNNGPSACVAPATTTSSAPTGGSGGGTSGGAYAWSPSVSLPFMGYGQSNSSVVTTSSTNTYIEDSYNSSVRNNSQTWSWDNGNTTNSGNNFSHGNGNTRNTTVVKDNGNTSNTTVVKDNGNTLNLNSGNTTQSTNNQTWNQDNGNTANTTTNTTNNQNNNSNQGNVTDSGNDNSTHKQRAGTLPVV